MVIVTVIIHSKFLNRNDGSKSSGNHEITLHVRNNYSVQVT